MSSYKEIWDLRITCADEDLFPPLERNYSCATECARFYGMPVRRFYKDRERYEGDDEPYVIWNGALDRESSEDDELYDMEEDEVWLWRVLLVSDTHIAAMPPEIFEQQDMLLVYRTSGKSVRCENDRVLGVCINKKSSFKGKETQAGYHCANKYEQWTGYKK